MSIISENEKPHTNVESKTPFMENKKNFDTEDRKGT